MLRGLHGLPHSTPRGIFSLLHDVGQIILEISLGRFDDSGETLLKFIVSF